MEGNRLKPWTRCFRHPLQQLIIMIIIIINLIQQNPFPSSLPMKMGDYVGTPVPLSHEKGLAAREPSLYTPGMRQHVVRRNYHTVRSHAPNANSAGADPLFLERVPVHPASGHILHVQPPLREEFQHLVVTAVVWARPEPPESQFLLYG
jgi:hypothetical protein